LLPSSRSVLILRNSTDRWRSAGHREADFASLERMDD
jgi:hypothetical protein